MGYFVVGIARLLYFCKEIGHSVAILHWDWGVFRAILGISCLHWQRKLL